MSENLEHLGKIARALVENRGLDNVEWDEAAVVFGFSDKGNVNDTYGYAYDSSGDWTAISFRPREIREPVDAYREWLRREGDKGLIRMLFQMNRISKKVNAVFEYDDGSRWNVTAANLDRMIEELRPNLGG